MEDQPKKQFPMIWKLEDPPHMEERTAATIVHHDSIKTGDLLMIVTSSAVKMDITPQGPKLSRVDNDPSYNGVLHVWAYCFPFIACKVLSGPMLDERLSLDVRRHKFVKVSKTFWRALLKPEEKPEATPSPDGGVMIMGATRAATPEEMAQRLFGNLASGGWQVRTDRGGGDAPPATEPPPGEPEDGIRFFPPDELPPPDEDNDDDPLF
jgi:hypothetical protein